MRSEGLGSYGEAWQHTQITRQPAIIILAILRPDKEAICKGHSLAMAELTISNHCK